jgi:hypothetical protein
MHELHTLHKRPITIALIVAGLIAGTTAGIAAINSEVAPKAEPVALQPATEMKAESQVVAEAQAPTTELVAQAPAEMSAQGKTARAPAVPAARNPDEQMVRIPFTDYYVRVTNPTFPSAAMELPEMLPATIAFLEQREATRLAASQPKVQTPAPVAATEQPAAGTTLQTAPITQAALTRQLIPPHQPQD